MKVVIRVTASKTGQEHMINVDNIVHFTDATDGGTLIYLASAEHARLFVRETPEEVLNLIDEENQHLAEMMSK